MGGQRVGQHFLAGSLEFFGDVVEDGLSFDLELDADALGDGGHEGIALFDGARLIERDRRVLDLFLQQAVELVVDEAAGFIEGALVFVFGNRTVHAAEVECSGPDVDDERVVVEAEAIGDEKRLRDDHHRVYEILCHVDAGLLVVFAGEGGGADDGPNGLVGTNLGEPDDVANELTNCLYFAIIAVAASGWGR